MKIDFEGQVRVLDLDHVKLRHAVAVQGFTGLALMEWTASLLSRGSATEQEFAADPVAALKKLPMFGDRAWVINMAAAYWLMTAQAGENPPDLDDDYDCDVIGFAAAFITAALEEAKAKAEQDQPGPTVSPGRRTPSSRRTAAPKKPKAPAALEAGPLPYTGS